MRTNDARINLMTDVLLHMFGNDAINVLKGRRSKDKSLGAGSIVVLPSSRLSFCVKEFVRKKDKLGREYCREDGVPVPCGGPSPASMGKKPQPPKTGQSQKPRETYTAEIPAGVKVALAPAEAPAFTGEPVDLSNKLNLTDTGRLGEAVVLEWLRSQGKEDARPLNADKNNTAVDAIEDHRGLEIKCGLVSNRKDAQKWRVMISKPGKKEKEAMDQMTPKEKAAWNAKKQKEARERKEALRKELGKELGHPLKVGTVTVLLDPDRGVADVLEYDNVHDIIRWNSEETKAAYRGSFAYNMRTEEAANDG